MSEPRHCRVCGCTDERACRGGCYWVEPDLCSAPGCGGPGYWQNETSGVLIPAVEAYLEHRALTAEQIAALRKYFRQWIMAPVWDKNPHATDIERIALVALRWRVDAVTSCQAIDRWLEAAEELGLDPL